MLAQVIRSVVPMSTDAIQQIEALAVLQEVAKGDVFIQNKRRNTQEYFVLDGICKSYLVNPEGEEVTLSFYTSDSVLPPHISRTRNDTSLLNFKALTTLTIAALDAKAFQQLMIEHRGIREFGNTVLRNELVNKTIKEIGMASLTAKERLIHFRTQYPMLENSIPHPDIASYLGITNVSLSRLRKNLSS